MSTDWAGGLALNCRRSRITPMTGWAYYMEEDKADARKKTKLGKADHEERKGHAGCKATCLIVAAHPHASKVHAAEASQ